MSNPTAAASRIYGLIEEGEAFNSLNARPQPHAQRQERSRAILNSQRVLTITAVLYGTFGTGWLVAPAAMGKYWAMQAGDNLTYMGHRYGAMILGLVVILWMARHTIDTQARRAVLMGALVATTLTTALSLYGALALSLNAWPAIVTEALMGVSYVWVLFIKPESVV